MNRLMRQVLGDRLSDIPDGCCQSGYSSEERDEPSRALDDPAGGRRLSNVQREFVDWLSPGWAALGKLIVIEGEPGVGKSRFMLDWAARVSTGVALPGGEARAPASVILLCAEDGIADTVVPSLMAAGADLERIIALDQKPDGSGYRLPWDTDFIEATIQREGALLVVVDTLVPYIDPRLNPNSDRDVRQVLSALSAAAARTNAAIVVVRHLNKRVGASALHRGSGSIGISGAARLVHVVAEHPGNPDQRVVARVKGNIGTIPASIAFSLESDESLGVARVVYQGEVPLSADDLVMLDAPVRRTALQHARSWLGETLAKGPLPTAHIEDAASREGISNATLRRARTDLQVVSKKSPEADGPWLLSLPSTEQCPWSELDDDEQMF